jgi:hypothetical protein
MGCGQSKGGENAPASEITHSLVASASVRPNHREWLSDLPPAEEPQETIDPFAAIVTRNTPTKASFPTTSTSPTPTKPNNHKLQVPSPKKPQDKLKQPPQAVQEKQKQKPPISPIKPAQKDPTRKSPPPRQHPPDSPPKHSSFAYPPSHTSQAYPPSVASELDPPSVTSQVEPPSLASSNPHSLPPKRKSEKKKKKKHKQAKRKSSMASSTLSVEAPEPSSKSGLPFEELYKLKGVVRLFL